MPYLGKSTKPFGQEWSGRGQLSGVERVQGEDGIKKVKGLMKPDNLGPCDSL